MVLDVSNFNEYKNNVQNKYLTIKCSLHFEGVNNLKSYCL